MKKQRDSDRKRRPSATPPTQAELDEYDRNCTLNLIKNLDKVMF